MGAADMGDVSGRPGAHAGDLVVRQAGAAQGGDEGSAQVVKMLWPVGFAALDAASVGDLDRRRNGRDWSTLLPPAPTRTIRERRIFGDWVIDGLVRACRCAEPVRSREHYARHG
jgi:hypothetical protein